ncbi:MAG: hypothetical protein ABI134_00040 [Byssovorax sp.]
MKTKAAQPASASKSGQKPVPTDHIAACEAAFTSIEDKLLALPADRLNTVTINVQVAGIVVLAVANAIAADKALRARFEALAKAKEFDIARLDGLKAAASRGCVRGAGRDRGEARRGRCRGRNTVGRWLRARGGQEANREDRSGSGEQRASSRLEHRMG